MSVSLVRPGGTADMDCCVSMAAGSSACMTVPRKPSSTLVPGVGSALLFHVHEALVTEVGYTKDLPAGNIMTGSFEHGSAMAHEGRCKSGNEVIE